METYFLPNELRKELKKIWGFPIFGKKTEIAKNFGKFCQKKKFKNIITVGDYCSFFLPSDIKIFDGRVGRNKKVALSQYAYTCLNPPSSINKTVWETLQKAIISKKNVFVNGEEDLLVIPCVLLAEKGTAVVYGFPGKGICLIEVTSKTKKIFNQILKQFKKEKFKKIILGGTFSGLHPGHRYFLSLAGYYAKEVLLGLCSDRLVKARKRHFKKLLLFGKRKKTLENYLRKTRIKFEIVEIDDIYGPAITDKAAEAILLTEDTLHNGKKINVIRKKNNLKELHCIVLPYLWDKTGKKISSRNIN